MYLRFQRYFVKHHILKTQSELTEDIENSQNWMFFLQGEIERGARPGCGPC